MLLCMRNADTQWERKLSPEIVDSGSFTRQHETNENPRVATYLRSMRVECFRPYLLGLSLCMDILPLGLLMMEQAASQNNPRGLRVGLYCPR